jgi:hypothetical protein
MEVGVAKDWQGVAVHAVSFVHEKGPVFYASLPSGEPSCAGNSTTGCGTTTAGEMHRLVSTLWDHLAAVESPLCTRYHSSCGATFPVQVVRGLLGRPHLLLGEYPGPAISCSEGGGRVWAALCGDESDIGIDAAGIDEFQGEYPVYRVFHPQELQHALRLTGGDTAKASALLWSIKEAVVKALGCAFHLVDPRQVCVCPPAGGAGRGDGGYTFPVCLSGKALIRFPQVERGSLWVRSLLQRKTCLSIALLDRRYV